MGIEDSDFLIRNLKSRGTSALIGTSSPASVMSRKAWETMQEFCTEVGSMFPTYPAYEDHPDRTRRKENALNAVRRVYADAGAVVTDEL